MTRRLFRLTIALTLATTAIAQTTAPTTRPTTRAAITLREAAGDRMLIGTAVMSRHVAEPRLGALVSRQFNCLTAEYEFKPEPLQPRPGAFDFAAADRIVAFADAHDMTVVGHTLLWHQSAPRWLFADASGRPLPRAAALENLRRHVAAVAGHFKGKVIGWDVVNEAIDDGDADLRDTPARRAIGDDYVEQAFAFARAADPDVELYYNDYNIEQPAKRDKTLKLIRRLKEKGLRVDGVGIQGHWGIGQDVRMVDDAIRAFQAEGVKVMITELDLNVIPNQQAGADVSATQASGVDPYKAGLPADVQRELADKYAALFEVFKERGVTRVTFWGPHDGASWLNDWPVKGRTNHPLLFDRDLKPKPAFDAVVEVLRAK